mmetsp:Transcript_41839/g.97590  ORF Transcript_41839/g.97590 Transcript_41839/m.97590 type:complete len:83 (+) Transcript_41839:3-251(+)
MEEDGGGLGVQAYSLGQGNLGDVFLRFVKLAEEVNQDIEDGGTGQEIVTAHRTGATAHVPPGPGRGGSTTPVTIVSNVDLQV